MDLFAFDPSAQSSGPMSAPAPNLAPAAYLRALHPVTGRGKLTLFAKLPNKTASRCLWADEVAGVLDVWLDATSYVSMNRFHGPRRSDRLAELNALYVDLDVYRVPSLGVMPRPEIARIIERHLDGLGLPDPSVFIDSGRGFYLIWLVEPCPAGALVRWQAVQRCLVELLAPLGADPACVDAARVLRLPGTVNTRSSTTVSVIGGDAMRYDLDMLGDAIFRASGRPTRGELKARKAKQPAGTSNGKARGLPPRLRFAAVLRDLERIRIAWGGAIPEGIRNTWLHLALTALTFTALPNDIMSEAERLADLATPGLSASEVRSTAKAAVSRAEAVVGPYLGPGRDPRLNYSGQRMTEVLGVSRSMAEAFGLEQLIPEELRLYRRNARRREKRVEAGGQSREDYLSENSASREKPWVTAKVSRSGWYKAKKEGEILRPVDV